MKYFLSFLLCFIFPVAASANSDFDTKIVIDYRYDEGGRSTVTQNINITYNNSQKYVSRYRFKIFGDNIANIKAYDSKETLETLITNDNTGILVEIKLNNIVVGKGNGTSFVISYTGNKATNNGKVWEITLPNIENWYQHKELVLNLFVPKKMGQMAFMSPNASNTVVDYNRDYQLFTFTKERLGDNQVVAAFGNLQSLSFDLTYRLDGPGPLVLPSDDNYQRIFINSINPTPDNLVMDNDGNWLAQYPDTNQSLDVRVIGEAHLLSTPIRFPIEPAYSDSEKYPGWKRTVVGQDSVWNQTWNWGKHAWISDEQNTGKLIFAHNFLTVPLTKMKLQESEYSERSFSPLLITWSPPWQIFSIWKTHSSIEVVNPNGQAVYHLPILLTGSNLKLKLDQETREVGAIPPFGKVKINFSFLSNWKANFDNKSFSFFVGGQEITYNVGQNLFLFWHVTLSFVLAFISLSLGFVAIISWRLYLQRRKRQDHLRR